MRASPAPQPLSDELGSFELTSETGGFSIFRYNRLQVIRHGRIQWPVYLTLGERGLEVYVEGIVRGADADPRACFHDCVFSLPFGASAHASDEMARQVHRAGRTSVRIRFLGDARYEPGSGYEGLGVWHDGATARRVTSDRLERPGQARSEADRQTRSDETEVHIRRILLELLFDLHHRRIFERSAHYTALVQAVSGCPVLTGILRKSEYYWWREVMQERESQEVAGQAEGACLLGHVVTMFREAEHEWLRSCLATNAKEDLLEGTDWFRPLEHEVHAVVFHPLARIPSRKDARHLCELKGGPTPVRGNLKRARAVASWFLLRYDLDSAARVISVSCLRQWLLRPVLEGPIGIARRAARRLLRRWLDAEEDAEVPHIGPARFASWAVMMTAVGGLALLLAGWFGYLDFSTNSGQKVLLGTVTLAPMVLSGGLLLLPVWLILRFLFVRRGRVERHNLTATARDGCSDIRATIRQGARERIRASLDFVLLVFRLPLPRLIFATTAAWMVFTGADEILRNALSVTLGNAIRTAVILLAVAFLFVVIEIHNQVYHAGVAVIRGFYIVTFALLLSLFIGHVVTNVIAKGAVIKSEMLASGDMRARMLALTDGRWAPSAEEICAPPEVARLLLARQEFTSSTSQALVDDVCVIDTGRGHELPTGLQDRAKAETGPLIISRSEVVFWQLERLRLPGPGRESSGIPVLMVANVPVLGRIVLIPAMLLRLSVTAVFVALFLQLVFEDKAISEPL